MSARRCQIALVLVAAAAWLAGAGAGSWDTWTKLAVGPAWGQPAVGDPDTEPSQSAPALFPPLVPAPAAEGPLGTGPGSARPPVSEVIFPPQAIPLRFSHVRHLRLPAPPACVDCHRAAPGSMSSLDSLIPPESACRPCHAIDRARADKAAAVGQGPARCDACHPGYRPGAPVARVSIPTPNIKFPHRPHIAAGATCTGCHGDLGAEGVGLATRAQLPKMVTCRACHDGRRAPGACTTCHLADPDGRVRTTYPSGLLVPSGSLRGAAHDLGFRADHAGPARSDPDFCASCHQERFCVDCHDGVVKPFDFHGGNYLALHPLEARRNTPECSACHRLQSFCVGCHTRAGVSPGGRGSEFDSAAPERRFHPPGWTDVIGPGHHGVAARRNIQQCASCHREQFCVGCHTAEPGALGANPHPPGWSRSRRCRALLAKNPRVCLRCHLTPAELRCGG
ncbi:cytochrome c3 family protein [Haliangium sp.]|uniref:cytochrome c3 family protein n=1 Tax=Haliangium sp. TaxID=2663208 RepID=UPI003D10CDD7